MVASPSTRTIPMTRITQRETGDVVEEEDHQEVEGHQGVVDHPGAAQADSEEDQETVRGMEMPVQANCTISSRECKISRREPLS